jgi:hypothetical protein
MSTPPDELLKRDSMPLQRSLQRVMDNLNRTLERDELVQKTTDLIRNQLQNNPFIIDGPNKI